MPSEGRGREAPSSNVPTQCSKRDSSMRPLLFHYVTIRLGGFFAAKPRLRVRKACSAVLVIGVHRLATY
jgi:hypothetical protein